MNIFFPKYLTIYLLYYIPTSFLIYNISVPVVSLHQLWVMTIRVVYFVSNCWTMITPDETALINILSFVLYSCKKLDLLTKHQKKTFF